MNTIGSDPGFSIEHGVVSPGEVAHVLRALESVVLPRSKAGARHMLSVPAVRSLAYEPRLQELAACFIGPVPIPFRATLFDKSARANWLVAWHQDTALPVRARVEDPAWGPWSIKAGLLYAHAPSAALEKVVALRVSLDDSTEWNGPLRVLPQSHVCGVLSDVEINRLAAATTPVSCITEAGGVVVMRPLAVHASSKSIENRPRRVLHIEYASTLEFGKGLQLAPC